MRSSLGMVMVLWLANAAWSGCDGRVPVGAQDAQAGSADRGQPQQMEPVPQPEPPPPEPFDSRCAGENAAIVEGQPLRIDEVSARAFASLDYADTWLVLSASKHEGVPFEPGSKWSGVSIRVVGTTPLSRDDLPQTLNLAYLPPGWKVGIGLYGGSCMEGSEGWEGCKSNSGGELFLDDARGSLHVYGGDVPTATLCLVNDPGDYIYLQDVPVEWFE